MMTYVPLVFGVLGILFGLKCYHELWKWAKQCQRAQIVIAYNKKVRLSASLSEWLGWVNQLPNDANGRAVYHHNHTSVSILRKKPVMDAKTTVKTIRHSRRSRKNKVAA